jgi:poly-gamma-glutamate capsule biosynthesis protein CapA/YwtB (metallophosphatase superfamily)
MALQANHHNYPSPLTHCAPGYPTVCQMRVARILVAAGADIVLGAHSHTQQPAEVLLVNGYVGDTGEEQAALKHVPECCRLTGVEGPPRKALVLYGMGAHCVLVSPLFPPHTTPMRPMCMQATSAAPCSTKSAALACS